MVLVLRNVRDDILDLQVHVFDILEEVFHCLSIVNCQIHIGQLVCKMLLVALNNHVAQILMCDFRVVNLKSVLYIVDS